MQLRHLWGNEKKIKMKDKTKQQLRTKLGFMLATDSLFQSFVNVNQKTFYSAESYIKPFGGKEAERLIGMSLMTSM